LNGVVSNMGLTRANLINLGNGELSFEVQFNPSELSIDTGVSYAEIQVPGLQAPILQFVRGEAETLSVELFLDGSATGQSVQSSLQRIRALIAVDPRLRAPPLCRLAWGDTSFTGVVTSLKEKFSLFSEKGDILRARVGLVIKRHMSEALQAAVNKQAAPNAPRQYTSQAGDRLDLIASNLYGDPAQWRLIAAANGLARVGALAPGTALRLPARK
jgi:hypothetical protein